MKTKKYWLFGIVILVILILITLFYAPNNNQQQTGSTYNRQPNGYSAWYEYMKAKNVDLNRWEKPILNLVENQKNFITLLQIQSEIKPYLLSVEDTNWLRKGNNLIILGVGGNVTKAQFTTYQNSELGKVRIDSSRRGRNNTQLLGDEYGIIVSEEKIGEGKYIEITTPYLAANAYQDYPVNYQFLEKLVNNNQPIFIDEYLHGYKDKEVITQELKQNLISYFLHTPLVILLIQLLVLLLVFLWGFNKRFGKIVEIYPPQENNSQAYINALANILKKAQSKDFILENIGKEKQIKLQKKLGLGNKLLPSETIIEMLNHDQEKKILLKYLLDLPLRKNQIKESELLNWLENWQSILNSIKT